MVVEPTDEEVKADIMNRLFRKHCWGARYFPLDTLMRWISKRIKNGRRIERLVRQLFKDGYIMLHKKGETISLNPARSREILEFIRRFIV